MKENNVQNEQQMMREIPDRVRVREKCRRRIKGR